MKHGRAWLLGGMTALLVARPLFPSESAASHGDGLTMVMLWIAMGVFWLLGAVGRPHFSLRWQWTDAAVSLLVLWHTAAALWAAGHGTPRPALNMLWEWVGLGLCFFLARQLIDTPREVRAVAAVMVALAAAVSGYGLYQRAYELPHTRAQYLADPDRALRDAGLWFPPHSPERKLFEDRLANTEPMATFALCNSLAGFLAPWLVVLAGIIAGSAASRSARRSSDGRARSGERSRLPWKGQLAGMLLPLVLIVACLLSTKSRSGYAGACAGVLLVWLLRREKPIRIGWKLPAVVMGLAVLVGSAATVVEGPAVLWRASKSFGYRLQYWQSSLLMIADHPWLGCGPGNFQEVYTQYKLPEASEEIADPHNFLLEIWATAGTPAALAFLGVLGCFAWSALGKRGPSLIKNPKSEGRNRRSTSSDRQAASDEPADAWRQVLLGGLAGFPLSLPLGMLGAAPPGVAPVVVGLPLAAATLAALLNWIRDGQMPPWLPAVGAGVLLIVLSAAGGIGFPGIAGTFWLLLALGLFGEGDRRRQMAFSTANSPLKKGTGSESTGAKAAKNDSPEVPVPFFHTWVAWTMLAGAVALAAACYSTAYRPVMECQAQLLLADQTPANEVEHLEAAAAADPLSAEPWRRLAEARFEAWQLSPSLAAFERFEQADAEMLRLTPNSASAWAAAGERCLQAASAAKGRGKNVADDAAGKAVTALGRAAQLYPNNARNRAKLAEACAAAGDLPAFRREAEAALWLDEITPHADKKLPAALREKLRHDLGGPP